MGYSFLTLLREALHGHRGWPRAWRAAEPKKVYEVIVVGGGGHGLATAFHLVRDHGLKDVAVLEQGAIGQGNVGRNTTIVRSNYMLPQTLPFYEHSLRLWERLSHTLGFNVMFSQRGVLDLFHSDDERDLAIRRGNAMRLYGIEAELLDESQVRRMVPLLAKDGLRFPIRGGLLQARAGNARHDAVAWGYAHAADRLGVDIIENCRVTGFKRNASGKIMGVDTTRGPIEAKKVALAVAGHCSQLAGLAGVRLPLESHLLQAFVSEGLKPIINTVVTFGIGHLYISQSDKGSLVFGGSLDGYNSYARRGNLPLVRDVAESVMAFMPALGRIRLLRHWAGVMDMTMDGAPIIDRSDVEGLYLSAGWCYGGFKAVPAGGICLAHLLAMDDHHPVARAFTLDRFAAGRVIDEKRQGPQPNLH